MIGNPNPLAPVGRRLRSPPDRDRNEPLGERRVLRRPGEGGSRRPTGKSAFTLVEVIVALGILGGGLVAVMAMFAPLARVGGANDEMIAAVEAAGAVNAHLRQLPFAEVVSALPPTGEAGAVGTTLLVDRSGEIVGAPEDPVWIGRAERPYFEVALLRNQAWPASGDPQNWPTLVFNLRVRWPVSGSEAVAKPREIFLPGSIHR